MDSVLRENVKIRPAASPVPIDLQGFFAPKTLALVGATEDRSRFGGKVLHRLQHFGFNGPIYPVNPSAQMVQGLRCYRSLRDLPESAEHVGIAVPTKFIFDALDDCAATGARFVTVFSAGFTEAGDAEGLERQSRLKAFVNKTGIRIMGPNCNGFVNFVEGLAFTSSGTVTGARSAPGNIGLVSQSGGAAQVNVMWRAQELGLHLSRQVSCGNCADLGVLDFVSYMIDDPHTDVIMLLVEDLGRGQQLFEVAKRAADREKPIIVLKLGRTEAGSRAAASHTGAITGSDAVHDAVFKQCGMIRVNDCNELYERAMIFRRRKLPNGRRAAALSISGGNAAIIADLGEHLGVEWPRYADSTQVRLGAILPLHGRATNPSDVTSAVVGKPDVLRNCVDIIASDPSVDVIIPTLTFAARSDVDQVVASFETCEKPLALLWTGGCGDQPDFKARQLIEAGMPVYRDALACLRSVKDAMSYGEFIRARKCRELLRRPEGIDLEQAGLILRNSGGVLGERLSKAFLKAYGFPVTEEYLARSAEEAVDIQRRFGGRVALKIESKQILHKTESGAIRLGIEGTENAARAFDEVMRAARAYAPDAELDGVLVQAMAPAGAIELILGIAPDPTFGSAIMVGLGGVHVEVLRDVSFRVGPIGIDEAHAMLRELRAYRLLEGVRGRKPVDMAALCHLISRLSWLAVDFAGEIDELDINPLFVYPQGQAPCVLDALITTKQRGAAK
jgi:acetate---CoA ligase (ADP-forming)